MNQPTQKPPIVRRWSASSIPEFVRIAEEKPNPDIIWQAKGTENLEAYAWT